ncbi:unnamed protein product [Prorocentrum cordatum]|uniref:MFS transporter n=1 Tax=Prorocentrum cordatum TaxID=2364126 RepID=A0ABN9TF42_9DINO|nr:unnamed protein product [Polarella glacialis]
MVSSSWLRLAARCVCRSDPIPADSRCGRLLRQGRGVQGPARGHAVAGQLLALAGAGAVLAAYCAGPALLPAAPGMPVAAALLLHVGPAVAASALLGALGPCLETVVSLRTPVEMQGAAMGTLNAAMSLGGLAGHLVGTTLWTVSASGAGATADSRLAAPLPSALMGGRLPYVCVSALLALIALALRMGHAAEEGLSVAETLRRGHLVGMPFGGDQAGRQVVGGCGPAPQALGRAIAGDRPAGGVAAELAAPAEEARPGGGSSSELPGTPGEEQAALLQLRGGARSPAAAPAPALV